MRTLIALIVVALLNCFGPASAEPGRVTERATFDIASAAPGHVTTQTSAS